MTIVGEEMPDGAHASDDDEIGGCLAEGDPHAALANIDLDEPLRPGESLPVPAHRMAPPRKDDTKTFNGISSPEPDVDLVVSCCCFCCCCY